MCGQQVLHQLLASKQATSLQLSLSYGLGKTQFAGGVSYSAEAIALHELEEAKRKLLEAQSGREYADSMVKYHEARIKRLTTYIRGLE